ncbi:hypothetical protein BKA82DRAFT_930255 [Pisolithus tinctorius]|uniref:RecQ mediated genome instability protein 1 OB-fold domain-containing protein n=1 Tax=Pisolithus tinctorius Marx 270 TaxID=870435 RepID=A0A0C3PLS6_PISTI|nr:hypothetical protein BKA82DRAFT_930255 [Pisolithus tinctorius]KIO15255.1 hypothetical protein M404DRAFT_930255 [Pisolithus tinctorius Marx 270]
MQSTYRKTRRANIVPAPERVVRWVSQNYPRPTTDSEWLSDCCDWISSTYTISPATHFHDFISYVETQLLQSGLEDSTVPGTGLASRRPTGQRPQRETTGSVPLLVEIRSITEIAHSAFSLLNICQTRLIVPISEQGKGQQDEDQGPIPRFPRGILRFELSDGHTLFQAIEFRFMPELVLGETPLGFKVCPLYCSLVILYFLSPLFSDVPLDALSLHSDPEWDRFP